MGPHTPYRPYLNKPGFTRFSHPDTAIDATHLNHFNLHKSCTAFCLKEQTVLHAKGKDLKRGFNMTWVYDL